MTRMSLDEFLGPITPAKPTRMTLDEFLSGGAPVKNSATLRNPEPQKPLADLELDDLNRDGWMEFSPEVRSAGQGDPNAPAQPAIDWDASAKRSLTDSFTREYNARHREEPAELEDWVANAEAGGEYAEPGANYQSAIEELRDGLPAKGLSIEGRRRIERQKKNLRDFEIQYPKKDMTPEEQFQHSRKLSDYFAELPLPMDAAVMSDPKLAEHYRTVNELITGRPLANVPDDDRPLRQAHITAALKLMEATGIKDPVEFVQMQEAQYGPQWLPIRAAAAAGKGLVDGSLGLVENTVRSIADLAGMDDPFGGTVVQHRRNNRAAFEEGVEVQKDKQSYVGEFAAGVVRQTGGVLGRLAPAAGAAAVTKNPNAAIAMMSTGSGTEAYNQMRAQGWEKADALTYATATGAIEALTERLGVGVAKTMGWVNLNNAFSASATKAFAEGMKRSGLKRMSGVAGSILGEGSEEVIAEMAGSVKDAFYGLDPALFGSKPASEQVSNLAKTFAIGGLAGMAGNVPAAMSFILDPNRTTAKLVGIDTKAFDEATLKEIAAAGYDLFTKKQTEPPTGQTPEGAAYARQVWADIEAESAQAPQPPADAPLPEPTPEPPAPPQAPEPAAQEPDVSASPLAPEQATTTDPDSATLRNPEPPRKPRLGERRVTPPPAEGTVRFYHGGDEQDGPRWFSQDPEYAKGYATKDGRTADVYYVDLPVGSPLLRKAFDDSGTDMAAPYVNFEAPPEIASQAQRYVAPPDAPPAAVPSAPVDSGVAAEVVDVSRLQESSVQAQKQPDGSYKLAYTGTRNEVFPGEKFTSASEARGYFKAVRQKQRNKELDDQSPDAGKMVEPPKKKRLGERRPRMTEADFKQKLTAAATSPEEADMLTKLVAARAATAGESLDDYVGKRFADVVKTDASESLYLKQLASGRPDALAQAAYHGSPHKFDKFTLDKIGTGEGAQVFGWGLYFAGNQQVAKYYREKLRPGRGDSPRDTAARILGDSDTPARREAAITEATRRRDGSEDAEFRARMDEVISVLRGDSALAGSLYRVDLKPESEDYIDWDKPFSGQSDKAKAALTAAYKERGMPLGGDGTPLYFGRDPDGDNLYTSLAATFRGKTDASLKKEASKLLQKHGIRGIRYLDGSSRGEGEGDSNYVIFDDADVVIEEVLAQKKGQLPRGEVQFIREDGRAIIRAFTEAQDLSTLLHELGHVFRRDLSGSMLKAAEEWAGVKNGRWNRTAEEKFARGFERYLREGKAPTKALADVFAKFKQWLSAVYKTLKGSPIDVKISPEMQAVYDSLFDAPKKRLGERKVATDAVPVRDEIAPPSEVLAPVSDEKAVVVPEREEKATAPKPTKAETDRVTLYRKRRRDARTASVNERYWKELMARSRKLKGKAGEVDVHMPLREDSENKSRITGHRMVPRKAEILTPELALTYTQDGDGGKKEYALTHTPTGLSLSGGISTITNLRQLAQLVIESGVDLSKVEANGNDENSKRLAKVVRAWDSNAIDTLPDDMTQAAVDSIVVTPTATKADLVLDSVDLGAHAIPHPGYTDKGLKKVKEIAKAAPEFAYEPVFTVNADKQLVFKDGVTYKLNPGMFNLAPGELTEGQTVGINLEDIGVKPLTAEEVVVQSLKNWGFGNVRSDRKGGVTGSWGGAKVALTGSGDKWTVAGDASLNSVKNAVNALKKIHWYAEGEKAAASDAKPKKPRLGERKVPAKASAAQGAATGGPQLQPATPAVIVTPPKSQRAIIAALAKAFDVPIRFGRLRDKRVGGQFFPLQNLITSKKANDIPIVAHEIGHKLDDTFKLSSVPEIAKELDHLGDPATPGSRSSWTKSKTPAYRLGEGMAEFVRYWLIEPDTVKQSAPKTLAAFEKILDANKDVGDALRQAQDDIRVWRMAEPQARLRSHISVGENPNKTRWSLSQLTRDVVDDLHYLRLATEDAKLGSPGLMPSKNPYLLARNLRGSYGMAATFIQKGVVDFKSRDVVIGSSLEDALKPVGGRINDFRDWIVAKRAKELHGRGIETGLVKFDVDAVVKQFDADRDFVKAFDDLKKWNDAVLQYAVDSGLVTDSAAATMREMNQDYVPFHRLFEVGANEDPSNESTGKGSGLNAGTPGSLKKLKGSTRNIVDPLETMVKNAYAIVTASEKASISLAVADMANLKGMGKWVEQVAGPMQPKNVRVDEIIDQLADLGADVTALEKSADVLTFFRQATKPPKGENTISIVRDGKTEFYRLNRYLHDTFEALDLDDAGALIKMFSQPAQLLRAGVTLEPGFNIANMLRDTIGAAVISKYGALPFETTLKGIAALAGKPQLVAQWAASGGQSSVEANYFDRKKMQQYLAERISKDLTPAERALIVTKSPLKALRWLSTTFEEATRIGEYEIAYKALTKGGMPEGEARRLAAFEARDRQDFAKGGAKTKILRRTAAFWNAQVQANVRLAQSFKERPIETTLKGLAFVTLPKLVEQALNWDDEDYWERPQWERDAFYMIPIGKDNSGHTRFLRVPVPFEIGLIFASIPGRFLQWAKKNDPDAVKDIPTFFAKQTVPVPNFAGGLTVLELLPDQGYSHFRGREIVPDSMADMPKDLQWTQQTSELAKKIAKGLSGLPIVPELSPMKVEYFIESTTGGLGKVAMGKQVPGERFVSNPLANVGQPITDFYDIRDKLTKDAARIKATGEHSGYGPVMLSKFEDAAGRMGELRNKSKATTDPIEKAKLDDEAYQIAREMVQEYKANPEPDAAVTEYAEKLAKKAILSSGRPQQKKRKLGSKEPGESAEDYRERLRDWEVSRDASLKWLKSHKDSPIVKDAVKEVAKEIPARPSQGAKFDPLYNKKVDEWKAKFGDSAALVKSLQ